MKNYYVYFFLDLSKPGFYEYDNLYFNFEPFYVGKGNYQRIKTSLSRGSNFKMNKIKKVGKNSIKVIKIYDNLENEESLLLEKEVIFKIGRRDLDKGPLVNLTDGGDGRLTSSHIEEVKMKISNTKKSQNLSIAHSDETKEILRIKNLGQNNPMFGKYHTDEVKEKQSLKFSGINHPMFGKKHDEEAIKKIKDRRNKSIEQDKLNEISRKNNSKSIIQIDLNGEFISEYESIKIASIHTGISESTIGKICRGDIKKPSKFIFRFKNNEDNILKNSYQTKIGDIININGVEYKLVKRNTKSFVVEIDDGKIISFRRKDYDFIWNKKELKSEI
jgi:hypothetical protein